MYRIRLATGEEAVYRSVEELALAVSSGVVSPNAEVFHKAAHRWLPIETHPDYRAALVAAPTPVELDIENEADPPSTQGPHLEAAPAVSGSAPRFTPAPGALAGHTEGLAGPTTTGAEVVEEYDPAKDPTPLLPAGGGLHPLPDSQSRVQKLRIMLAVTMGLVGIALVAGGGYLMYSRLAPALEQGRHHPALMEGMEPDPRAAMRSDDSFPTSYPAPSAPLGLQRAETLRDSSAETRTSHFRATPNRKPGYIEAYADARAEMDEALGYINFQRVFAPNRISVPDSVRVTRRMVQAAANIVRVYRGREVMLEQSYRPDDPGGAGSFREPFETAEAVRSILADVDSLYGVLLEQDGRFTVTSEGIRIPDRAAAANYAHLRRQITSAMDAWADSLESRDLVTMPRLLRALGPGGPPPLRN